jgi:uncharacterized iron-regulated membrane protein
MVLLFLGLVAADGLMLAAVTGAIALFGPRLMVGLPGPPRAYPNGSLPAGLSSTLAAWPPGSGAG